MQVIDSALKKIDQRQTANMITHFVNAAFYFMDQRTSFILDGMKKYKIKKILMNVLFYLSIKNSAGGYVCMNIIETSSYMEKNRLKSSNLSLTIADILQS